MRRNTLEENISMKEEILKRYISKEANRKETAKLLHMHKNAVSRLTTRYKKEGKNDCLIIFVDAFSKTGFVSSSEVYFYIKCEYGGKCDIRAEIDNTPFNYWE